MNPKRVKTRKVNNMDTLKLDKWANLLLDTGKRNNLINFKDTKSATIEILLPNTEELFQKVDSTASFEVFDPKIIDDDEDEEIVDSNNKKEKLNRQEYMETYGLRIKKRDQILLYNCYVNPINALKNIDKKARSYIEETGVNVCYIAFGFIHWKESKNSQYIYRAPILLAPVTFSNESAISPWFIKLTEEDVIVNPTFNFKLESEWGVTLPEYKDEDLTTYLKKVEELVKKMGWSVSHEAKIGIFSFLKMNMYKDLKDHQESILQNNNVRMLLGESYETQNISIEKGEHQLENPLVELHNVVDADSSQIEAIEMAKAGVSFVLQGPPGTGKSQTITNIIAECISDGKKVLFVSEKQAALNVVYDKLRKAGLEDFCLELHSYKSNKKSVIENICKTLKTSKTTVSNKADQVVEAKARCQKELDAYEAELHRPREVINMTLYQLYNAFAATRNAKDINVTIRDINKKGEDYLRNVLNLLNQYVEFIPSIGYQYKNNAWYGYINQDTSYQMREDMKQCIEEMSEALQEYLNLQKTIEEKYGIVCNTLKQTILWNNFFNLASESSILTPAFLKESACSYLLERLTGLERIGTEIISARKPIDEEYESDIYTIDASDLYKKLTQQFTSGFKRLFNSEYREIISNIKAKKKDGKKPTYEECVQLMKNLNDFHEKSSVFFAVEAPIKTTLGSAYKGINSDWPLILNQINQLKELFSSGASFSKLELFSNVDYEDNKSDFSLLSKKMENLQLVCKKNTELLSRSFDKNIFDIENEEFAVAQHKIQECLQTFDGIDNWCIFNNLLQKLNDAQLLDYIDAAIQYNIPGTEFVLTYQRNFYRQWIDYIQHLTPTLTGFNRVAHDRIVNEFAQEDKTQFEISKVQIKENLSSKRPSLDFVASGSAVSILLREGEKKRKQKSIRTLMSEAGELIQVIKPCFLMSPLSVSTFLDSDIIKFDVVIFDEASQIFPQDAIGSIYRGKQLIVVGDSKQMPPSNFFNSSVDMDDTDEETGDITDFESILDLCSTTLPQLRLRWHYRSRYEQLISFSNKNFYDKDLITFPSAITDSQWIGVDYYAADGIFDHKSRNNRKEAEFIVDLIFKNIEKYPDRSLGVVAFSVSQQDLIEKLLSKRRQEDTSKEFFFKNDKQEPFFVKNLETVQGDERDTIIFSVAYAKDSTGRLMHNFGPLNRAGGERRLNVAVTRAKINVQLVASIHYSDIDLKRTNSEGAKLLREYLDYAENGEFALERGISVDPFEQYDSEFELEVCEYLREKGFDVDTQVGCSGFKIDLGLKRPKTSDYILAIECDGATYHSSKNARDRDRLRQQILESMGWKFYRIWSTDWFKNTNIEKERLLDAVQKSIAEDSNSSERNDTLDKEEVITKGPELFEEQIENDHKAFPIYELANVYSIYEESSTFQEIIRKILKMEAPLSEEWLLKRIPWMFGREKVTSVVQRTYETYMRNCEDNGIVRRNGFLYLIEQKDFVLRIPDSSDNKREIKYISDEEIASGMRTIIEQNVALDKEGLYRYIVHELGFHRMAEGIVLKLDHAFELVKNFVDIDGENIHIKDNN